MNTPTHTTTPYRLLTKISGLALLIVSVQWQPAIFAQSASPMDETSDKVLQLETFKVSTTIEHYHETTSAMATKVPMELKEVSSSLQILNSTALMDRNAVSLQDVYTYIIGMNQVQPNANGFTFRGFSSTGTYTQNLNFDGLMGTTSSKGALSADNVERVEFLKGPNSVLYGQMKPGGMLNIVTKIPKQNRETTIRTSLITYAGRYDNFGDKVGYVGSLDTTGPIDQGKHWLYRLVVSGSDLSPFRNNDFTHSWYIYPSLTYRWSDQTYLTLKGEFINERRHFDDNLQPVFNNADLTAEYNVSYQEPTDFGVDKGHAFSTFFTTRWADNWILRINTRATWHTDEVYGISSRSLNPTSRTPIETSLINRRLTHVANVHNYNFADVSAYGNVGPEKFKHTLLVGLYGGTEFYENKRLATGPNTGGVNIYHPALGVTPYPPDGIKTLHTRSPHCAFSWYVSDQIKIQDRWHLSLGTRYEQQGTNKTDLLDPTVPHLSQLVSKQTSQAGLVYDVTKAFSVYGSWSQSFVPADVGTLDENGNSGFPSETGEQKEVGLKFETPSHDLYVSLAAFEIVRSNVSAATGNQLPDGRPYFRLDGEQTSKGVELETQWRPILNWQFQGGLSYTRARITESATSAISVGRDLANAPRFSANFWTRYNVPDGMLKGLGAGLGIIRIGEQYVGNPTSATAYFTSRAWTRVDTAFYYKWHRYEFALDVKNIFDKKYIVAAFNARSLVPGEPRKFTFSVTRRF